MTSFNSYGIQLDTTWLNLIESTNRVYYMYQMNSMSIGCIVSKVEGGGGGSIDTPHPLEVFV